MLQPADEAGGFSGGGRHRRHRGHQPARRAADLAMIRYRAGQVDYLSVSSAEQSRLQTADAAAQARAAVLQAVIAVYRAMGGAWPDTG